MGNNYHRLRPGKFHVQQTTPFVSKELTHFIVLACRSFSISRSTLPIALSRLSEQKPLIKAVVKGYLDVFEPITQLMAPLVHR